MRRTARAAFTIVEALVALATVVLLLGLLVIAVQAVRGSAGEAECRNRLKQLGVALHNHQDIHRILPTNGGWDKQQTIPATDGPLFTPFTNDFSSKKFEWGVGDPARPPRDQTGSWLYSILPFVEQEASFQANEGWTIPVPLYVCSTRRDAEALPIVDKDERGEYGHGGWKWAKTDYAANGHVLTGMVQSPTRRALKIAAIGDGAAQTLLAGEKAWNVDYQTPNNWYFDEPFFLGGSAGTARKGIVLAPDGPDANFKDNWGSAHAGGVQFVFADASVRSIPFDVDWQVFSGHLKPNDGDIVVVE